MSGGEIFIAPHKKSSLKGDENVLAGNTCLYGATGGSFFLNGIAGDRFAVRNSGAIAVVEGVGLHACEYMTGGTILLLGMASMNIGAGMTGGLIYTSRDNLVFMNEDFLVDSELTDEDKRDIKKLYQRYTRKLDIANITYTSRIEHILTSFIKLKPKA
mgnify:CR=1 FL=1